MKWYFYCACVVMRILSGLWDHVGCKVFHGWIHMVSHSQAKPSVCSHTPLAGGHIPLHHSKVPYNYLATKNQVC